MGTKKKLVLASLVSLMMVLAFVIGLVPNQATLGARAASGGGGRVDMVDLLNAVLDLKSDSPLIQVAVTEPLNGAIIKVPSDTLEASLSLRAVTVGNADNVMYGIDGTFNDPIDGESTWHGDLFSGITTEPPNYPSSINLLPLVAAATKDVQTAHLVYALANAEMWQVASRIYFTYALSSVDTGAPTQIFLETVDGPTIDANNNGIPDNILSVVQDGETWLVTFQVQLYDALGNPAGTTVCKIAVASLADIGAAKASGFVTVSPDPNLTVSAPNMDALGDLLVAGETAYVIVSVSDDLRALLTEADPSIAAWANGVIAKEPSGGPVLLAPSGAQRFVAISLLAINQADGSYREIQELPEGLSIDVALRGLDIAGAGDVELAAYPIKVTNPSAKSAGGYELTNLGAIQDAAQFWERKALRDPSLSGQAADEFVASLTSASAVFVPFKATMSIDSLVPAVGAAGEETATTIFGNFVGMTAMTLEDAEDAYAVYFGTTKARFGDLGITLVAQAKTLALTAQAQALYVYAPPLTSAGFVDVTVVSLGNPSDTATKTDGFEYKYKLTTSVTPIDATGGHGTLAPPTGLQTTDAVVDLLATAEHNYRVKAWTGTDNDTLTTDSNTVTMSSNRIVTVEFEQLPDNFTLTTSVIGGHGTLAPLTGLKPRDSVVGLTATPEDGYRVKTWTGTDNDMLTTDANTVTMSSPKIVTVEFELIPVTTYMLTTSVIGGNGTLAPLTGPQTQNAVVDLLATPANGYQVKAWTGTDNDVLTTNANTVTMSGDKAVTVEFELIPPLKVTLTTNANPTAGGTVAPSGATQWNIGDPVDLLATANLGYKFASWTGSVANPLNASTSILMTQDETVTANFTAATIWTVTLVQSTGGHVVDDHAAIVAPGAHTYTDATQATLVAVPDSGYSFVQWQDAAGNQLSTNANYVFTVTSNVTVKPIFASNQVIITGITPGEAWLFGGVVAKIQGQGFKPTSTLTVNGQAIAASDRKFIDSTLITFVVPPLTEQLTETAFNSKPAGAPDASPSTNATVELSNGVGEGETATSTFVYKRYDVGLDNVVTTAFQVAYSAKATSKYIPFALDGLPNNLGIFEGTTNGADFTLPLPNTPPIGSYYGLIRAAKRPRNGTVFLTSPLLTDRIDNVAGASKPVANAWDFSVHFYGSAVNQAERQAALNQSGAATGLYDELPNWQYDRQASGSGKIAFPVADTVPVLTVESMARGITTWATETTFDYGADPAAELAGPALNTPYQSAVLTDEYVTGAAVADTLSIKQLTARVYDFSAFSLRVGSTGHTLAPATVLVTSGGSGASLTGGSILHIHSDEGGLAYTRIGFHHWTGTKAGETVAGEDISNGVLKQCTSAGIEVDGGLDEFDIYVKVPAYPNSNTLPAGTIEKAGVSIYSIADLYPTGDDTSGAPLSTATPRVVLTAPVTYAKVLPPTIHILPWLLAVAGLIAAIAVGIILFPPQHIGEGEGEAGGGGGGPCFIATAAYGTPLAADINTLRALRDTVLLTSGVGTAFVEGYYHVSPYIADFVAKSPVLASMVRVALVPVIMMSNVVVAAPVWSLSLGLAAVAALVARRVLRRKA